MEPHDVLRIAVVADLLMGREVQAFRQFGIGLHRGTGAEGQSVVVGRLCKGGCGEQQGQGQQDLSHCST